MRRLSIEKESALLSAVAAGQALCCDSDIVEQIVDDERAEVIKAFAYDGMGCWMTKEHPARFATPEAVSETIERYLDNLLEYLS